MISIIRQYHVINKGKTLFSNLLCTTNDFSNGPTLIDYCYTTAAKEKDELFFCVEVGLISGHWAHANSVEATVAGRVRVTRGKSKAVSTAARLRRILRGRPVEAVQANTG